MHTIDLSTASLNDIVFEGRNKAYGAFVLRQLYHRHLARALTIAVALSLLFISSPLIYNSLFPPIVQAAGPVDLPEPIALMPEPVIKTDKPAGGPAARPQPTVRPPQAAVPKVVPDSRELVKEVKPEPPTVAPIVDEGPIGPVITETEGTQKGSVPGGTGDTAGSGLGNVAPPSKPFDVAEVMPKFVGGNEELMRYMQKNLRYPPMALRNGVSGRVYISFTVQADGTIADVQVLKGLGFGTDEEAARVVKNMPAWTPGQQNKHNVAVRYTMPITFHYE